MGRKEKMILRLLSLPKDMTFAEVVTLLGLFGFRLDNKGRTSGSRCRFTDENGREILLHKPHQANKDPFMKRYQLVQIIEMLRDIGQLGR